MPTPEHSPSPVVELGFADGRRAQMPPASPQTAALVAAATRLLERRA
jgi:hypothetical protein